MKFRNNFNSRNSSKLTSLKIFYYRTRIITLIFLILITIISSLISINKVNIPNKSDKNLSQVSINPKNSNNFPSWNYSLLDSLESVAISYDGNYIVAGGIDKKIYLFQKTSSLPLWSHLTDGELNSVALSSDGNYIVAGGTDDTVYLFHRTSSTPLWVYKTGGNIRSVAISSDGSYIVAGTRENRVYLFHRSSSTPSWSYTTEAQVNSVSISADGHYISAGSSDHNIYLFERTSSTPLWINTTRGIVNRVMISSDGNYIAAILGFSTTGQLLLFHASNSVPLWEHNMGGAQFTALAISSDGNYIVSGGSNGNVMVFHKSDSRALWYRELSNNVFSVAISLDGNYIAAGCRYDNIYFFHTSSSTPLWTYSPGESVNSLALSSNGDYLVAGCDGAGYLYLFSNEIYQDPNPNTQITSGPSGTIDYNDVTFTWIGFDDKTPLWNLVYSYYLNGYDTEWSDWTSETSKTYYDLPEEGYIFSVKSRDIDQNEDPTPATQSFTYSFQHPNNPPIADFYFTPESVKAGELIEFDASASEDEDGNIISYEWDWDGDGNYDTCSSSPITHFRWIAGGTFNVVLKVTDNDHTINTKSKLITVHESFISKVQDKLFDLWDFMKFWDNEDEENLAKIDNWLREFDQGSEPFDWLESTEFNEMDLLYVLKKDMDQDKVFGFSYEEYILNLINEEKLIHEAFTKPTPTYLSLLQPLLKYAIESTKYMFVDEEQIVQLLLALEIPLKFVTAATVTIGLGLSLKGLFDFYDFYDKMRLTYYSQGLCTYFLYRIDSQPDSAWDSAKIGVELWLHPSWDEETKIQILEEQKQRFEDLWLNYDGQHNYNPPDGIPQNYREQEREMVKNLLISVLEKYDDELPNRNKIWKFSPIEMRIFDSQGRITGEINGQIKEEIPNALYDNETEMIIIFFPNDTYYYEIEGMNEGTYGLKIISIETGDLTTFNSHDIPVAQLASHRYLIDWDTLSLGEQGVNVSVDSDGDGLYEHSFFSDNELTQEEYLDAIGETQNGGGGGGGGGGGDDDDDDVSAIPFGNYYLPFMVISIISLVILTKRKIIFSKK
jgi:WD40 repeat protein